MALIYKKEGRIAEITLNRPEAMNSFDPEQCEEFSKALIDFRDDPEVWVAIITGAGEKAFSAGADLKKLVPVMQDKELAWEMPPLHTRGLEILKPLIAAINGVALGGGLEMALACDLRIASENATLGVPEVRWGLYPGWGGTQRLPRVIPWAKAAEMLLMGRFISAQEALQIGLINKIVPLAELMPTARAWAQEISELGPLAVRTAKELMLKGTSVPLDVGLRLEQALMDSILASEDAQEGPKAFAEKRKPVFKAK